MECFNRSDFVCFKFSNLFILMSSIFRCFFSSKLLSRFVQNSVQISEEFLEKQVSHHHLAKFFKIHCDRTIFINFLIDAIWVLGSQARIQFTNDFAQVINGDESSTFFVKTEKSFFEFGLHGLLLSPAAPRFLQIS